MSYQDGQIDDTQVMAKRQLTKLITELQRGIFSQAKLDLANTNPDEFLDEFLPPHIEQPERAEVIGIIKHTIVTGFFRTTVRRVRSEKAEEN